MSVKRFFQSIPKVVWAIFLVSLPVTSFPYLPAELGGKTQVRPFMIYPLIILLILVTLPRLFTKPLPITFLPLFAFIAVAMVSSILSLTLDIEAFKGVTLASRLLRSFITLGIGVAVYLTVVLYHRHWEDLRFSLRWLYIGFVFVLFWGSLQAIYIIHFNQTYFSVLNKIQSLISTQDLYTTRISGFTYEPKWFAEQITFLLMPWLLASVISRRSVYNWNYKFVSVELLLMVWSTVVLVFTFSRTGLFVLVLLTFTSVLLSRSFRKPHKHAPPLPIRRRWLRVLEATLAALALIVIIVFAGSRNPYFARLWRYWSDDRAGKKSYLEYIAFGQRFAYAETALRIYEDYPILGVGLGNYAFYFEKKLPDRPWQNLPEIIRQITPTERGNQLITPKNLYARLLAETGLLGTITFTTFVIAVLGCSLYLIFAPHPEYRFWGLAGIFGIIVFATVVFSTDSFAIPNLWVVFGLITAAAHIQPVSEPVLSVTKVAAQKPIAVTE